MTAALACTVKLIRSVDDLVSHCDAFNFLQDGLPTPASASRWRRGREVSEDLQVIVMGKSGYGKSTTLNSLIGEVVFDTSDTEGCTRIMQSVEFKFPSAVGLHYFSLADLPGIGENPQLDAEYIELYRAALEKAHAVIYFMRADQRDYSIDEWVFGELFQQRAARAKVIVALNAIDKVEPLNRRQPVEISADQWNNVGLRIAGISKKLKLATTAIVPISATAQINTHRLVARLSELLLPHMQPG
jgi:small GTP-binding protein